MTTSIFISYSHEDRDFMLRLREDLTNGGFDVWVDDHSLAPGTPSWEKAIEKGITQANYIIAILSPEAKNSIWVTREIAVAEGANKNIVPILIKGDETSSVPFRLRSTQRIDARNKYNEALNILVNALSGKKRKVLKQPYKKPKSGIKKGIIVIPFFLLICICSVILIINNLGLFAPLFPQHETSSLPKSTLIPTFTPTVTSTPVYKSGFITYVVESEDGDRLFSLDKDGKANLLAENFYRIAGISTDHNHLALIVKSEDSTESFDLIIVSPTGELLQHIISGAENVDASFISESHLLVIVQDELLVTYSRYDINDSIYELQYISENSQWFGDPPTEEVTLTKEVQNGE